MSIVYYVVKGNSNPRSYYASENYTSESMAIVDPDTLEIKNGKAGNKKYVLFRRTSQDEGVLVRYSELENLLGSNLCMGQLTEPIEPDTDARLDNVYSVTLRRGEKKAIAYVKDNDIIKPVYKMYIKDDGVLKKIRGMYKKENGQLKGKMFKNF